MVSILQKPLRALALVGLLCTAIPGLLHAQTVVWDNGAGTGAWGTGTNWSTDTVPSSASNLSFGTASGNQSITLGANRQAQSLTFTTANSYTLSGNKLTLSGTGTDVSVNGSGAVILNSNLEGTSGLSFGGTGSGTVTVNGIISGTSTLTKDGSNTLVLNGTNTFSGNTTLNSGTLEIGNNSALGAAGNSLLITGGTLSAVGAARSLSNAVSASGDFTIGGSQALTLSGNVNLGSGPRTITVNNSATTTFSGVVSNAYYTDFIKAGSGRLVLSNANTFSGPVTVSEGILTAQNANALGGATYGNTVNAGATLELQGSISLNESQLSITGSGAGGIGALRSVSGTNTFAGALAIDGATTIAVASGSLAITGQVSSTGSGNISFLADGDLSFSNQVTLPGALSISGAGTVTFNNTFTASGSTLSLGTGQLVLNGDFASDSALTFTGAGSLLFAGRINTSNTLTFDTGGSVTLSGATTNNTGTIQLSSGTLTLSKTGGASAITGNLIIGDGAGTDTVLFTGNNQLAAYNAVTVNSSGVLNLNNFNQTLSTLNLNGGTINTGTGTLTLSNGLLTTNASASTMVITGNLSLGGSSNTINTADGSAAVDLNLNAVLSGSGGLIKEGAGTLLLSGTGGYTGDTSVNAGTLRLGVNNALVSTTKLTVGSGAILDLAGYSSTVNTLAGAGSITLGGGTLSTSGSGGWNTTFSGTLSGAGNFVKGDTNTLTLSGTNTYTGSTTVSGGTLTLGSATALPSSTALSVSSGATLNMAGYNATVGSLSGAGTITQGTGTLTTGSLGTSTTFSGVISGTGGLVKTGSGTLSLTGSSANTFSGGLTINDGGVILQKTAGLNAAGTGSITVGNGSGSASSATLQLGANNQISNSARVTLNSDGYFNVGGYTETIGSIASSGGTLAIASGGTLSVGSDGTSSSFSGALTGAGALVKQGSGTLTIASNVTFGGTVTVEGGTLAFTGAASGSTIDTLVLKAGATLQLGVGGSGTYNITNLKIEGNSTISFGDGTSVTLSSGTFSLTSGTSLTVSSWTMDDLFLATNWTGAVENIKGQAPMNQVNFVGYGNNKTAWIPYGSGNHQITPIPEPEVYGALFAASALGLGLALRRRRARQGTRNQS